MLEGGRMEEEREGRQGVQSLEIGMTILRALVNSDRSMMLRDIAARVGMSPPKVHRYLVSMIRAGLVERDPGTTRYALGPFALHLGLAAIDRLDRVRLGIAAIAELRDRVHQATALAVWGDTGPVIVRWERPRLPITVNVVTGVQLRLLDSAAGRVFAAWLPRARVAPLITEELRAGKTHGVTRDRNWVNGMLAEVRRSGVAVISDGYFAAGVEAMGAPVFNIKGEISMALVIVAVRGTLDMGPDGAAWSELRDAAAALSERLGHTGSGAHSADVGMMDEQEAE